MLTSWTLFFNLVGEGRSLPDGALLQERPSLFIWFLFGKRRPYVVFSVYSYLSVLSSRFSSARASHTLLPCLSSYLASVTFEPRLKILVLLSKRVNFLSFAGMNGLSSGSGGLRRARLTFPPFSGSRTLYMDVLGTPTRFLTSPLGRL